MSTEHIDRILETIDVGLQGPELASASDSPDCVRHCGKRAADESDFCSSCRAFLLGDAVVDPAAVRRNHLATMMGHWEPLTRHGLQPEGET